MIYLIKNYNNFLKYIDNIFNNKYIDKYNISTMNEVIILSDNNNTYILSKDNNMILSNNIFIKDNNIILEEYKYSNSMIDDSVSGDNVMDSDLDRDNNGNNRDNYNNTTNNITNNITTTNNNITINTTTNHIIINYLLKEKESLSFNLIKIIETKEDKHNIKGIIIFSNSILFKIFMRNISVDEVIDKNTSDNIIEVMKDISKYITL